MKKLRDDRGIAHILLVVLALVVVGAAGAVGYMIYRNSSGGNVSVDKAVKDRCMTAIKDKKFCIFAAHFGKIGDYKLSATIVASGVTSTFSVNGASNGNSETTMVTPGQPTAKVVVYGGTTYTLDPSDNQWIQYAPTSPNKPELLDLKSDVVKSDFKNESGQALQYKYVSKEACGKLTCYKYQEVDPQKPNTKSYLLFDTKNYLLRSMDGQDAQSSIKITMTYETVNIAKPAPVKGTAN